MFLASLQIGDKAVDAEWRAVKGSAYFESPLLYKENGFKKQEDAQKLIDALMQPQPLQFQVVKAEKKKETKNPPLFV